MNMVIAGVLRAALLMVMHSKDIGEHYFSKVADIMFDSIATNLTKIN